MLYNTFPLVGSCNQDTTKVIRCMVSHSKEYSTSIALNNYLSVLSHNNTDELVIPIKL